MLDIPYVAQPGKNACALAANTMVAQYFFPEITLANIAETSHWQPGYALWSFPFWLWMIQRGIRITDFDSLDYKAWLKEGIEGLRRTLPPKEFAFYEKSSKDLEAHTNDIQTLLANPLFKHARKNPTWRDLQNAYDRGAVCEIVLNIRALDRHAGFSLHRVVVLEVTKDSIVFHDPREDAARPERRESRADFEDAWLVQTGEPELCAYERV